MSIPRTKYININNDMRNKMSGRCIIYQGVKKLESKRNIVSKKTPMVCISMFVNFVTWKKLALYPARLYLPS